MTRKPNPFIIAWEAFELKRLYREYREHQLATYGRDNEWVDGVRTHQHTGGGAAYGEHALQAYHLARGHIYWMKTHKA